jgi:hypothetical protein
VATQPLDMEILIYWGHFMLANAALCLLLYTS